MNRYGPTGFAFVWDMGFQSRTAAAVVAPPVSLRVPDRVGGVLLRLRAAPVFVPDYNILTGSVGITFSVQLTYEDRKRNFSSTVNWNPVLNMSPITSPTGAAPANYLRWVRSMYLDSAMPVDWAIMGGGFLTMKAIYFSTSFGALADPVSKLVVLGESILGPSK